MKIAVVGNCQCESFAAWARRAIPDAEVTTVHLTCVYHPDYEQLVVAELETADIVLSQGVEWPHHGPVRAAAIAARPRTTHWPGFGFDGFHPDSAYLLDSAGGVVRSVMGDYNSRIIAAAFVANRTPAQTRRLFNSLSYARLGYFDAFPKARAAATLWLGEHGLEAERLFTEWLGAGSFMHTVNHPAIRVVADIARHALTQAGVEIREDVPAITDDPMAGCKWPIYPEIARRIGLAGDMLFVTGHPGAQGLTLEQMIDGSFEAYAALPPGTLAEIATIKSAVTTLQL